MKSRSKKDQELVDLANSISGRIKERTYGPDEAISVLIAVMGEIYAMAEYELYRESKPSDYTTSLINTMERINKAYEMQLRDLKNKLNS